MEDKSKTIDRREFLKDLGMIGAASLFAATPWLSAFSEVEHTQKEKIKLAIIGPGSRGKFHMMFLSKNPKVEITWLCDIYQPSIDSALQYAPNAKTCSDYRKVLEDKTVDAILIATPLDTHCEIACAAMDAGKDVFCEKSIGYNMEECYKIYMKHKETGKIFFSGQQRLFDPRYIKTMEMIHSGLIGKINAVHAFWNRNGDWRRPCPDPSLERQINWRLYKEHSKGLMTELACHQLQVGTWALQRFPEKVMGHGAITYWKDGREVYDNINLIYVFEDGVKMTYGSVISNKFYGLEEQILGDLGTFEPEKGKYYFETVDPAPAFLQMINEWENKAFSTIPFAGTSWAPETANVNKGEYILGERPKGDGTSELLAAFVEAVITQKQPPRIAEEGYYASMLTMLGHEALVQEKTMYFPEEYKLDYLNHKAPKKEETPEETV
ncbi:MAG: Gfo/Idh/MocA family oxidoreductase [Bacteroidales bacterium]|nr:Gfo/Idh/MocA family oxidoreductase [Bacteroidales bacterium]